MRAKPKSRPTKSALNGKTLNLADNMAIVSNNFNVDKNGNMTCNNGKFNGGKVILQDGTKNNANLYVLNSNDNSINTQITPSDIFINCPNNGSGGGVAINVKDDSDKHCLLYADSDGGGITLGGKTSNDITLRAGALPKITCYGEVAAQEHTYVSLEELKKNIEQYDIEAMDIIRNADIYSYNFKTEKDTDKKHIGFVIGDKYKTPQEVIAKSGDGIDTYAMTSILWKAIQELIQEIEKLKGGQANG